MYAGCFVVTTFFFFASGPCGSFVIFYDANSTGLFQMFLATEISHGHVSVSFRKDWIFSYLLISQFTVSHLVKEFRNSQHSSQLDGTFFWTFVVDSCRAYSYAGFCH